MLERQFFYRKYGDSQTVVKGVIKFIGSGKLPFYHIDYMGKFHCTAELSEDSQAVYLDAGMFASLYCSAVAEALDYDTIPFL